MSEYDEIGQHVLMEAIAIGSFAATWATLTWILYCVGTFSKTSWAKTRIVLCCQSLAISLFCLFRAQPISGRVRYRLRWAYHLDNLEIMPWAICAPILAYLAVRLAYGPGPRTLIWILIWLSAFVLFISSMNLLDALDKIG
jgi:hypothetical protein